METVNFFLSPSIIFYSVLVIFIHRSLVLHSSANLTQVKLENMFDISCCSCLLLVVIT